MRIIKSSKHLIMKNTCIVGITPVYTQGIVPNVFTSQRPNIFGDSFWIQFLYSTEFIYASCAGAGVTKIKITNVTLLPILPENVYFIAHKNFFWFGFFLHFKHNGRPESEMWFLYLKNFFIIITGQSTLFYATTQAFVRAVLIAFRNNNMLPGFEIKKDNCQGRRILA